MYVLFVPAAFKNSINGLKSTSITASLNFLLSEQCHQLIYPHTNIYFLSHIGFLFIAALIIYRSLLLKLIKHTVLTYFLLVAFNLNLC